MKVTPSLNNENDIMLYILRLNKGGLGKSSPYINISGRYESSLYRILYFPRGIN